MQHCVCKGDHPTSKNEQTEEENITHLLPLYQCAIHRTCSFTHLLSCISQQFTDRKPVYTAVSVYQCCCHVLATHRQKTSLLLCIGWQFTDREPVYTAVAVTVSISNSQTENQFTHLLPCIGWQLNSQKTSLHICCHVSATCRQNQFTHLLLHIGWQLNSQTENQFTHLLPCISNLQTENQFPCTVNNSHTKTSLHLCCCVSVGSSQQFTQLLPGINQQLTDRKPAYISVPVYHYQSTIHRQKPV